MTDTELAILHELSVAADLSAAELVRVLLRREHEARFGVAKRSTRAKVRKAPGKTKASATSKGTKRAVRAK